MVVPHLPATELKRLINAPKMNVQMMNIIISNRSLTKSRNVSAKRRRGCIVRMKMMKRCKNARMDTVALWVSFLLTLHCSLIPLTISILGGVNCVARTCSSCLPAYEDNALSKYFQFHAFESDRQRETPAIDRYSPFSDFNIVHRKGENGADDACVPMVKFNPNDRDFVEVTEVDGVR